MRTTVYFATNRPVAGKGLQVSGYGNGIISPSDSGQVTYATAFVEGTDLATDTSGRIVEIQDVSRGGFSAAALGDLGQTKRNILVFLHGFDNSFEDAIARAAYNREWMAASGVVSADMAIVVFSWPSLGRLIGAPFIWSDYKRDQIVAGQSGVHVKNFFEQLRPLLRRARASGSRCYLLCHSMGNWALQAAVESWFSHGNVAAELFDEAILAAADEQFDSFNFPMPGRLSGLASLAHHVSVLYSEADTVLMFSATVNGGMRRLGQEGPHNRADLTEFPPTRFRMFDCTAYRDYAFNIASPHQYYRRSPRARLDIISVL